VREQRWWVREQGWWVRERRWWVRERRWGEGVEVVGQGVGVVGDGARWSKVGRVVVVVVVGEGWGMRWLSEVRESTRHLRMIKPIPLVVTRKLVL
jgi:hypothetical protein